MSGYKFKWTLITWDCPFDTQEAKREARRLNRAIRLSAGGRMWGSVRRGAAMITGSEDRAAELIGRVPDDAKVELLGVTDKQFEMTRVVWGERRRYATA